MKRYDSYKDSGIEWIGEIPSDWSMIKIKNTVDPQRKITYGIVQPGEEDPNGILMIRGKDYSNGWVDISEVFRVSPEIESPYSRSRVKTGDIVYTIVGGVGNVEMVPNEYDGSNLTQTTGRISVKDGIYPKWIYFNLQSELNPVQIKLSHVGSVIPGISLETLKNFIVLLPPLIEQKQIVSYLDTKTSLIDSLIEKTQRKIELLKEKRTSLINEVVTKGLNPNVEMKDSGVEWIGEIPSHWEIKQLKHIIKTLNSGTSVNSEDTPVTSSEEFGVLKTSCVFGDTFRPEENKKVVVEEYDRVKCSVVENSIIISRMNTPDLVGSNGYVDKSFDNLFLPDRLWITEFFEYIELSVKWLSFVTISKRFRSELSSRSTGTSPSMKNITKDDLLTIKIPYPFFTEQNEIVSYLDEHTQLIDKTISIEERRIELLKEYRQSLISEVVTGKIDVRVN